MKGAACDKIVEVGTSATVYNNMKSADVQQSAGNGLGWLPPTWSLRSADCVPSSDCLKNPPTTSTIHCLLWCPAPQCLRGIFSSVIKWMMPVLCMMQQMTPSCSSRTRT
eukprot:5059622-Heterocapsa_arctica.AAC.1